MAPDTRLAYPSHANTQVDCKPSENVDNASTAPAPLSASNVHDRQFWLDLAHVQLFLCFPTLLLTLFVNVDLIWLKILGRWSSRLSLCFPMLFLMLFDNFEPIWPTAHFHCAFRPSARLPAYLAVCLSACLCLCLSVCCL